MLANTAFQNQRVREQARSCKAFKSKSVITSYSIHYTKLYEVAAMKPGSVIVDLAAERGGNCKQTVADEKIVTENGVTIIGYTDFVITSYSIHYTKLYELKD